jgi:hypothetical protein
MGRGEWLNSFRHAEEQAAEVQSRRGGYLGSRNSRDRAAYRDDWTTELIKL